MLTEHDFPVLELDDNRLAIINPSSIPERPFDTDMLIITFFPDVITRLVDEGRIIPERIIGGENPFTVYRFTDENILITLGQVGCPACGGNLDLLNAMGAKRVMFCGGGGVLDKNIQVGQLLLVDGAIRDEGFSYHYIPAARCIYTDPAVTQKIASYLDANSVPYLRGLTWTTDAIFRETADRVARRKAEGAKIVEMEQSGCIAVSQFRGFKYGALIYGGDDVSQDEWDRRGWNTRKGVRYDLVMLCRSLVKIL